MFVYVCNYVWLPFPTYLPFSGPCFFLSLTTEKLLTAWWVGGGWGYQRFNELCQRKSSFQSQPKLQPKTSRGWCYFWSKTQPFPPRATIMCLSKKNGNKNQRLEANTLIYIKFHKVHWTFMFDVVESIIHWLCLLKGTKARKVDDEVILHENIYFLWGKPVSNHDLWERWDFNRMTIRNRRVGGIWIKKIISRNL